MAADPASVVAMTTSTSIPEPLLPGGAGVEVRLRDGGRILIRAIRPDDRDELAEGMSKLSARSRFMRFHSHVDRLSEQQLDYLVDVDHDEHDALVALDGDDPDQPGVGVARYIRLRKDDPSGAIAEAAVTVADSHQGRGIGTQLLTQLERVAYARGVRTFRNYVLAENRAMLEVFRALDGEMTQESGSVWRIDVPVNAPSSEDDITPAGSWLASSGRLATADPPPAWSFPLLWLARQLGLLERREQAHEGAQHVEEVRDVTTPPE